MHSSACLKEKRQEARPSSAAVAAAVDFVLRVRHRRRDVHRSRRHRREIVTMRRLHPSVLNQRVLAVQPQCKVTPHPPVSDGQRIFTACSTIIMAPSFTRDISIRRANHSRRLFIFVSPVGVSRTRRIRVKYKISSKSFIEGTYELLGSWQRQRNWTKAENKTGIVKIFRFFLKSQLAIDKDVRKEAHRRVMEGRADSSVFDAVQSEVEQLMAKTTYPNFLQSDIYLQYVQSFQNPDFGGYPSSGSSREMSISCGPTPLPTLHEDREYVLSSSSIAHTSSHSTAAGTPLESRTEFRLTKDVLRATQKTRALDIRPEPEAYAGYVYIFMHPLYFIFSFCLYLFILFIYLFIYVCLSYRFFFLCFSRVAYCI